MHNRQRDAKDGRFIGGFLHCCAGLCRSVEENNSKRMRAHYNGKRTATTTTARSARDVKDVYMYVHVFDIMNAFFVR